MTQLYLSCFNIMVMYYFIDTSMRLNNNLDHIGRDTYIHTHGGDETKKKKKEDKS